jgi:hypothetical protein
MLVRITKRGNKLGNLVVDGRSGLNIRMTAIVCEAMGLFRVTEDRVQLQTILQTEVDRVGYPAISHFQG